jgi:hypothetical protein
MKPVAVDILMTILLLRFYRRLYIPSVEAKGVAVTDQRINLPQGTTAVTQVLEGA